MKKQKQIEQTHVAVDALCPNPWNPNKQSDFIYAKEKLSIEQYGFIDPITCRAKDGNGKLQIIDGEHRWKAAKDLGLKTVPVINLGEMSDVKAKQLTILLNEIKGQYDPFKMGEAMASLLQDMPREELDLSMPFSTGEIDNFLKLGDFDWKEPELKSATSGPAEDEFKTMSFRVSEDQAETITKALDRIKEALDIKGVTADGQALELIAADSLNTPIESYK